MTTPKFYRLGEQLSFVQGSGILGYLSSGWAVPEKNHCWTIGPRAQLRMTVQNPEKRGFQIRLECVPFLGNGRLSEQRVDVAINGRQVGQWLVRTTGWYEADCASDAVPPGPIVVSFEIANPTAPSE